MKKPFLLAWQKTPIEKGGIGDIKLKMLADIKGKIADLYNVSTEKGMAYRATIIIDEKGMVRHTSVNDLPIGRNVDEIIRIVDAIEFHAEHGDVCPAGWKKNDQGMSANSDGVSRYLEKNSDKL